MQRTTWLLSDLKKQCYQTQTSNIPKNIPGKWCILVSKLLEAVGSKTFFQYHSLLLWRKNYTKVSITPLFHRSWVDQDHKTRRSKIDIDYMPFFCIFKVCTVFICSPREHLSLLWWKYRKLLRFRILSFHFPLCSQPFISWARSSALCPKGR